MPHVEFVFGAVSRLAEHLGRLARLCSRAGFVNFKIQNRELQYASVRRGKPALNRKLSWSRGGAGPVLEYEFIKVQNLSRYGRNFRAIFYNGPVVGLGAVCVRVGMSFCIVPISGDKLAVMIKWSRWLCPDKRRGLLPVQKLADGDAKTMTTGASAGSPIDLVTAAGLVKVPKA